MDEGNKRYCISVAAKLKEHEILTDDKIKELTKNVVYRPKTKHYPLIKKYHNLMRNNELNNGLYDYMMKI